MHVVKFRWALGLSLALLTGLALHGCASDKNLVAHALNNVAARDNAYFIARTKLYEIETKLYAARVNDYNQVLPLFPTLDSAEVKANRSELNDIIKKASMPIQHRPGSDWTDDAYILVAWSRFYLMQFGDAELTFKYVNTTSKDPYARHEALIGLMRTFVELKQFENAKAVSDLLDKETGLVADARQLFLTRADYYLKTEEPAKAIPLLEKAVPLIPGKNERSRTRFILAQLYQEAADDKKATGQLNQILARNPPYELDFQAKLMLGQVSELGKEDRARLDKYFAGLLKDPKNLEYRDKIYYEMGRLDYRQKNYPSALKLLGKSVRVTTTNQSQKSYSYLLAGRIYYENLKKYRLAAAYYDSTVQTMPKTAKNYEAVKERSVILKAFAEQYTIIETQDSLQTLAKLDKTTLDQRLNDYATAELAAKAKAAAAKEKADKVAAKNAEFTARQAAGGNARPSTLPGGQTAPDPLSFDPTATAGGAKWYFDNPSALGTARADFIRKYGDRKLVDNWRTSSQITSSPNTPTNGNVPLAQTGNDKNQVTALDKAKADSVAKAKAADPEAEKRALVETYRKAIPLTPATLKASDEKIEAAYYKLGGIYKEQLKERESGMATYARQVDRYPRGEHAPEAYYLLYVHYKELPDAAKMAQYAAALQREFPTSIYAKLIADPLYREHELALHRAVAAKVDEAFALYKEQEFTKASGVLAAVEQQYPKHDLTDRVAYLKTLLIIRTQPPQSARAAVEAFYKSYPDSPLVPTAQALAAMYARNEKGEIRGALASLDKPVISIFRPGEVNNRLRIVYTDTEPSATPLPAPEPTAPAPKAASEPEKTVPAPAGSAGPAPTGSAGPAPSGALAPAEPPLGLQPSPDPTPPPLGLQPSPDPTPPPTTLGGSAPGTDSGTPPAPAAPGTGTSPAPTANAPAVPAVAYTAQLNEAHAVALVFPKTTPAAADLPTQLGTYNTRFFAANNLQVQPQALGTTQDMLIVSALPGSKVAQSYATKLRGPQSPLARLHGNGYQAVVISVRNLALLQASADLAEYLRFYQQNYK